MLYSDEPNLPDQQPPPQLRKLGYFGHGIELVYSDWITWYADDLRNMWSSLVEYRADAIVDKHIMNLADFDTFCRFCYDNSSKLQDYRK